MYEMSNGRHPEINRWVVHVKQGKDHSPDLRTVQHEKTKTAECITREIVYRDYHSIGVVRHVLRRTVLVSTQTDLLGSDTTNTLLTV